MGRIIAIGGGEIGLRETWDIDAYIASCTVRHPKLLFIPTASRDPDSYIRVVHEVYGELGCTVSELCLDTGTYTDSEIEGMILSSDIIYVGGGDTEYMMDRWNERNVGTYLKKAYSRNIVLSGLSAGSDCWFIAGYADTEFMRGIPDPKFKWVKGLALLPWLHSPHYNDPARSGFDEALKGQLCDAIALDNNTALVYEDGDIRILRTEDRYHAWYFENDGISVHKKLIE
ncbi:MAG: Type 1 glutamine amidotransferase-like domain-containing protein [Solobacterium sp.]|nr:Type 1 glutamine amidotransferase-like domain-containing protein [Solobacterium sp.]